MILLLSSIISCQSRVKVNKGGRSILLNSSFNTGTLNELFYANGYMLAKQMEKGLDNLVLNPEETVFNKVLIESFIGGILDYYSGKKLDEEYLGDLDERVIELKTEISNAKTKFAEDYFDLLQTSKSIISTDTGLLYKVISDSEGATPKSSNDRINIDYKLYKFDNFSPEHRILIEEDKNYDCAISELLYDQFVEGIMLMSKGDEFEFYIRTNESESELQYLIFDCLINDIDFI